MNRWLDSQLKQTKKSTLAVHHRQLERVKRIELSQSAWKAEVLPLNYIRIKSRHLQLY